MPQVHALSYIHPHADLADDVIVGPFCNVEADVVIGPGTVLDSHATIKSGTTLGENNYVGQGTVLGGDPQDRKFGHERTFLKVGNGNVFREYVTIHRATGEGNSTIIGSNCFIMAYSHMGHNGVMADNVTVANNVNLAGHVTIEELVTFGGMVGIHQYTRIGRAAMVGAMSGISRDVPPFVMMSGVNTVLDINAVGLRRIGLSQPARLALHKAVKLLYKSELGLTNAIETIRRELTPSPEIDYLIAFEEHRFKGKSGRGDQP